jgi:outer membrane protein OmpA-like peptidoglycan-associated protein
MLVRSIVSPSSLVSVTRHIFGSGGIACTMLLLAACAAPPPQGDVAAYKRVRFEDSPAGARAILDDAILFKRGEATFASEAEPVFDVLKPVFDRARGQVIIEGHTDTTGSAALNLKLSQDRADKVRTAMIGRRIVPSRLLAKGYGATILKRKPELTDGDAAINRRAEIIFVGETVASLNAREVETKANSTLDELANALKNTGKTVINAVDGMLGSLRK